MLVAANSLSVAIEEVLAVINSTTIAKAAVPFETVPSAVPCETMDSAVPFVVIDPLVVVRTWR
jgi:hypothetical protein